MLKGVGSSRSEARPAAGFELLYQRFRLPLYRFVRAMVIDAEAAEELTLKAFEHAYASRHSFPEDLSAGAWLHGFAVRVAMAHLRRRRLTRFLPGRRRGGEGREGLGGFSGVELALGALSPELRAVLLLSLYGRLSVAEIATVLDAPMDTVSRRLSAATEFMAAALGRAPEAETAWP